MRIRLGWGGGLARTMRRRFVEGVCGVVTTREKKPAQCRTGMAVGRRRETTLGNGKNLSYSAADR